MKAISIRQPWAWLIVNGYKDIENRSWPTRFRGRILIHTGKGMTPDEYESAKETLRHAGILGVEMPAYNDLQRGGIVGVASIDDCITSQDRTSKWHMSGQYGFHLVNAIPIPFVPCRGQLGIYSVEESVAKALWDNPAVLNGPTD